MTCLSYLLAILWTVTLRDLPSQFQVYLLVLHITYAFTYVLTYVTCLLAYLLLLTCVPTLIHLLTAGFLTLCEVRVSGTAADGGRLARGLRLVGTSNGTVAMTSSRRRSEKLMRLENTALNAIQPKQFRA